MLRKQPKGKKKVSSEQPTKGGWQMEEGQKKKGSGVKNLFRIVLLFLSVASIGSSFLMPSDGGVASIQADQKTNENNGKLVHVVGNLSSKSFEDPMFLVQHEGVGLKRIVEMYQWVEVDGQYNKEWNSEIIALSEDAGGRSNPPEMSFLSESWVIDKIDLGTFGLSDSIINRVINYSPFELTKEHFSKLNKHGQAAFKLHDGMYFWGNDPQNPLIGDIRVRFEAVEAGTYSILAKQAGGNLSAYTDGGSTIEKVSQGSVPLESMLKGLDAPGSGGMMTLILWGVGGFSFILLILTFLMGKKKPSGSGNEKQAPVKNASNDEQVQSEPSQEQIANVNQGEAIDTNNEANAEVAIQNEVEEVEMEADDYASEQNLDTNTTEVADNYNDEELPEMIAGDNVPEELVPVEESSLQEFEPSVEEDDNEVAEGIEMIVGDDVPEELPAIEEDNELEFEPSAEEDDNEVAEGIEMIAGDDVPEELPAIEEDNGLEFEPSAEEDDNEVAEGIEMIASDDVPEEMPAIEEDNGLEFEPSAGEDDNEVAESIEMIADDDVPEEMPIAEEPAELEEYDDLIIEEMEDGAVEGGSSESLDVINEIPDLPDPKEFMSVGASSESEPESAVETIEEDVNLELDTNNIPDDFDPNAEMEIDIDTAVDNEINYDSIDEESDVENDDKK